MRPVTKHILFWVLYTVYFTIIDSLYSGKLNLFDEIIVVLIHVWIFYSAYYFLKHASIANSRKFLKTFFNLGISLGIFYLLVYVYRFQLAPALDLPQIDKFNIRKYLIQGIVWYIQFFIYALGYYFATHAVINKKKFFDSEEKRLRLESAFLRARINPHFLHNSLNFLYSKAIAYPESKLPEAILLLSEIMRYSLEAMPDGKQLVPLQKEVQHLENFIKMNELRFDTTLNIRFRQTGEAEGIYILPLVLLTLVENAFKHGDLTDSAHPLEIQLALNPEKEICFVIKNKKKRSFKDSSHNIGIGNTRLRLEAAYGSGFSLNIEETNDCYCAALIINSNSFQHLPKVGQAKGNQQSNVLYKPNIKHYSYFLHPNTQS